MHSFNCPPADEKVDRVVVHCMFSQQRGPRAALRLSKAIEAAGSVRPSVLVLRGGWASWSAAYGAEDDLVAGRQ